jgi:large subunit ribosomal protein L19
MSNHFIYNNETYNSGDTVRLHLLVTEGDKTRTQIFEGIIIAIKGKGPGKAITVRKIGTGGIGVERVMPICSPTLQKIERKSEGSVRRAKLYYLRDRIGKQATKVKTKVQVVDKTKAVKDAAPNKKAPEPAKTETTAVSVQPETKRPARRTTSKKPAAK